MGIGGRTLAAVTLLSAGLGPAHALAQGATLPLEERFTTAQGPQTIVYDVDAPVELVEGGFVTLTIFGDFNATSETVRVEANGKPIAVLFDGEPDQNSSNSSDVGNQCASPVTTTLELGPDTIETVNAEGRLKLALTTSSQVHPLSSCGSPFGPDSTTFFSFKVSGVVMLEGGDASQPAAQTQTAVASSLTATRTGVTLSTLPSLSGRMSGGGGPTLSGSGGASQGAVSFAGDLSGLRRAAAAAAAAKAMASLEQGLEQGLERGQTAALETPVEERQPFDVWFGGSYSYFDASSGGIGQEGGVGTLQAGVDTRLNDRWLFGFAVFGDLLSSDVSNGATSSGLGFLAGPYAVVSVDDHVFVEALVALGRAANRIETPGLDDAEYDSDRLLLTGRISGDWTHGAWSFRPSTRLTYYAERQESFDAGDGSIVPENTTVLGQMRFGPEFSYVLDWRSGSARPFAGVEGVWAFSQTEQVVNGAPVSSQEFTGSLSLGVDALFGRASVRAGGRFDGLGDENLESVTGEITVRVPLR